MATGRRIRDRCTILNSLDRCHAQSLAPQLQRGAAPGHTPQRAIPSSLARRRDVCHREVDASGAASHFDIDVNHGQLPERPTLLLPCRKVVTDRDRPALASGLPSTFHLGPRTRVTGFASIGATGSCCGGAAQVIRAAVNGSCNIAPAVEAIVRVFTARDRCVVAARIGQDPRDSFAYAFFNRVAIR